MCVCACVVRWGCWHPCTGPVNYYLIFAYWLSSQKKRDFTFNVWIRNTYTSCCLLSRLLVKYGSMTPSTTSNRRKRLSLIPKRKLNSNLVGKWQFKERYRFINITVKSQQFHQTLQKKYLATQFHCILYKNWFVINLIFQEIVKEKKNKYSVMKWFTHEISRII